MDEILRSPIAKRQKLAYHHRHSIRHKYVPPPEEPALLPPESLDKLVIQSLKIICEEQAHKQDIEEPWIESVVLESLRAATDEFILNLCSKVRRSMQAGRRTVPIATDFDSAFEVLDIPRPDDQISANQTRTTVNLPLLPTPPPEDEFHLVRKMPTELLGPELSRPNDLKKFGFNTSSLPPLPSAHTYRDTAVFSEREKDTRRIRELATEEGKLGEQALRKLAGAVRLETALSTEPESRTIPIRRGPRIRREPVLTEEAVFEETMRDLLRQENGDFELGPVVSSEKMYRMPDEGRVKRRLIGIPASSTNLNTNPPASTKYNLLPPSGSKSKPPNSGKPGTDNMDISFEL